MYSKLFGIGLVSMALIGSGAALADQKIKTKSNIKNDRVAASSSSCPDAKTTVDTTKPGTESTADCKPEGASKSSAAATMEVNKQEVNKQEANKQETTK